MRNEIPEGETLAREFLANERTLLSWIRTGISAIGLGILLYFAAHVFSALSGNNPELQSQQEGFSTLAVAIIVFGVFLELVATARFIHYRSAIRRGILTSSGLVYLPVVFSLAIVSVAYAIYVVLT
jgi:putative membrane protein